MASNYKVYTVLTIAYHHISGTLDAQLFKYRYRTGVETNTDSITRVDNKRLKLLSEQLTDDSGSISTLDTTLCTIEYRTQVSDEAILQDRIEDSIIETEMHRWYSYSGSLYKKHSELTVRALLYEIACSDFEELVDSYGIYSHND